MLEATCDIHNFRQLWKHHWSKVMLELSGIDSELSSLVLSHCPSSLLVVKAYEERTTTGEFYELHLFNDVVVECAWFGKTKVEGQGLSNQVLHVMLHEIKENLVPQKH